MVDIREATINDNGVITLLSHQLGYVIKEADSFKNLEYILNSKCDVVFVAEYEKEVVGWIQVSKLIHLETGWFCEIAGLVTDENYRGKGVGSALINQAIEWTKENSGQRLVVRTNVIRTETHKFYSKQNFQLRKEQKVFEMKVNS
jgi:GNAT superfamily N-acetyltransferase